MDDSEVRRIIETLDKAVPRDGAAVRIFEYGGGRDESAIAANKLGYLRLGVELLKCAFSSHEVPSTPHTSDVHIRYLFTSDSDVIIDHCELRDDLGPLLKDQKLRPVTGVAAALVIIAILAFLVIGFVTVLKAIL